MDTMVLSNTWSPANHSIALAKESHSPPKPYSDATVRKGRRHRATKRELIERVSRSDCNLAISFSVGLANFPDTHSAFEFLVNALESIARRIRRTASFQYLGVRVVNFEKTNAHVHLAVITDYDFTRGGKFPSPSRGFEKLLRRYTDKTSRYADVKEIYDARGWATYVFTEYHGDHYLCSRDFPE